MHIFDVTNINCIFRYNLLQNIKAMKTKNLIKILFFLIFIPNITFSQDCEAGFYSYQDSIDYLTINFIDGSIPQGQIDTWLWDFGDENTSTEQNPIHTYYEIGEYPVTLTITSGSCSHTITETVSINNFETQDCLAHFSYYAQDSLNNELLTINFINLSDIDTSITVSWLWDFGDENTSTEKNPTHTYSEGGDYDVSLSISNNDCNDTYMDIIFVGDGHYLGDSCIVMFSFFKTTPNGLVFQFQEDTYSFNMVQYLWDFGDGTTSSEQSPIHEYSEEGIYTVSLTIQSNETTSYSETQLYAGEDTWYPTYCQALFFFYMNPSNFYEIQFDDISYGDGFIQTWFWDFGDGQTSNQQNPLHIYSEQGTYDVLLSIIADPCFNTFETQIVVNEDSIYNNECFPLFYFDIQGNEVTFYDISPGNPTWWYWDFGDGTTSDEQHPVHLFDEVGVHQIAFMVGTSIKSKSDSITHIMEIDFENSTIISSVVIPGGISTNINNAKSLYKDIKIYPNPADEILFIKLPQFEPINVEIYTITGQKVLTKLINSPSKSYLYVNNLQQGIYFIKINTKHYSTIKKFNK